MDKTVTESIKELSRLVNFVDHLTNVRVFLKKFQDLERKQDQMEVDGKKRIDDLNAEFEKTSKINQETLADEKAVLLEVSEHCRISKDTLLAEKEDLLVEVERVNQSLDKARNIFNQETQEQDQLFEVRSKQLDGLNRKINEAQAILSNLLNRLSG